MQGGLCKSKALDLPNILQNPTKTSMGELWALLHFIMPALFDWHAEFSEWFSRDMAESEHQLSRLHAILNPFMLRRVKCDVEQEMAAKYAHMYM